MDSHKVSPLSRLEVVETGRRRRFSEDEKLKIVLESLAAPRLVSATARRHGISRSLLLTWRRAFRATPTATPGSASGFVPAVIVPEPAPALSAPKTTAAPMPTRPRGRRIEIVLARGRRVIVDEGIDPDALARVLDVVERR
jgi:transposase